MPVNSLGSAEKEVRRAKGEVRSAKGEGRRAKGEGRRAMGESGTVAGRSTEVFRGETRLIAAFVSGARFDFPTSSVVIKRVRIRIFQSDKFQESVLEFLRNWRYREVRSTKCERRKTKRAGKRQERPSGGKNPNTKCQIEARHCWKATGRQSCPGFGARLTSHWWRLLRAERNCGAALRGRSQ